MQNFFKYSEVASPTHFHTVHYVFTSRGAFCRRASVSVAGSSVIWRYIHLINTPCPGKNRVREKRGHSVL